MGFASFIGGVLLGILAVILAVLGIMVLLGFFNSYVTGFAVPLGIVMLVVALILFAYGWYLYQSAKPRGTINVHNE